MRFSILLVILLTASTAQADYSQPRVQKRRSGPVAGQKNFMDYFLQSLKIKNDNEYHQKLAQNTASSGNNKAVERSLQEMDRDEILESNQEVNDNVNQLRQQLDS